MDRFTFHARAVIGGGSIVTATLMSGILGYIDDAAPVEVALQVGLLVGIAVAILVMAGLFDVGPVEEEPAN